MKNFALLTTSVLVGSLVITSCSSNKIASSGADDNLYFMASDVKMATEYAVTNNNPQSFKNISEEPTLATESFSSRNVNPEYISRYQAADVASTEDDGVVYYDENLETQSATGNINAYDNYTSYGNGYNQSSNGFSNINFNFGMGFGYSPWGWGMSPYMGFNYGWGFMPGFSIGMGFGWGYPMYPSYGWGYPMYPSYGWGYPGYGWGYPSYGWGRPVYPGYPSYVLPGGEYGNRNVVYGARPTRGSSLTNSGVRSAQTALIPSTARAQARNAATNSVARSPRRIVASENSRVASRDFGTSQNDYYNSGRSRVTTTRNNNSAAADRAVNTRSRSTVPSARPSVNSYPTRSSRSYDTPARSSNPSYNTRTSPSYNRSASPSYNNRSTSPSYNRSTSPSYNNRTTTPSRSNNTPSISSPSRSGGSSFSTPSRSSGGSSGSSVGGSRGGRGN